MARYRNSNYQKQAHPEPYRFVIVRNADVGVCADIPVRALLPLVLPPSAPTAAARERLPPVSAEGHVPRSEDARLVPGFSPSFSISPCNMFLTL